MDENKHPKQPQTSKETPKPNLPQANNAAPNLASRRIFAKKWMYPAIYLGAAALIIGLMYIKSQSGGSSSPTASNAIDGGTGTTASQEFEWPANTKTKVTLGFFSDKASSKQQAASLVFYDNGYYAHEGYDIQAVNKQPFSVTSAAAGKVTAVTENPVYGKTIEITTADGYTVRYESLSDMKVKQGDTVDQGQTIGTSGTCEFEKSQGNHLYFEVVKNGNPVDPSTVLPSQN